MKIKALPKGLRELAEKRLEECTKGTPHPPIKNVNSFVWWDTPEGDIFWLNVNNGNFDLARKIYDWDFMEETLPEKDGQTFKVILDEDWHKNITFEENPFSKTYFWGCDSTQKLKNNFENLVVKKWLEKSTHDESETKNEPQDENDFKDITDSIAKLLEYKNKQYGNSALEPLQIFGGKCTYGSRVDEKLARVQNSKELRKNDIADIIGGLVLICREKNWNNFDEYLVD